MDSPQVFPKLAKTCQLPGNLHVFMHRHALCAEKHAVVLIIHHRQFDSREAFGDGNKCGFVHSNLTPTAPSGRDPGD